MENDIKNLKENSESKERGSNIKNGIIKKQNNIYMLASLVSFGVSSSAYLMGLWNATIQLNEKGYFFTLLLFGLFSAIALQKTVRDIEENIPTTKIYYLICSISFLCAISLLVIGLWNADLLKSEKGFYGISFSFSLFSVITVQKNIRDKL